jgi:hypothetical protein
MTAEQPTQPWYTKTWVVILALWLFFPVGLYLMWRFTRWEVSVKTVVSVVISLLLILVVVSAAIGGDETDDDEVAARDVTPSPTVDVEATETATAVEADVATATAEDEEVAATATAEALAADETATAEAAGLVETATAEALPLAATATATASAETEVTPTPKPVATTLELKLAAMDYTENKPPGDTELWMKGLGSWYPDLTWGGDDTIIGPYGVGTTQELFVYPDGRGGVEIKVILRLTDDMISRSDRDIVWVEIYDGKVLAWGTAIEDIEQEFVR